MDIHGKIDALPETVRICLCRAIQEALTNCVKHAQASRVESRMKLKVLVADDHGVVRKGLRLLLEEYPELDVVGEAAKLIPFRRGWRNIG